MIITRIINLVFLAIVLVVFAPGLSGTTSNAFAVQPDEILADPALELRARRISKGVRCVVCRNQSIDDSNASLARDLRVLLRQRITAGDSDAEVIKYLVARYGSYILLKPPLRFDTILLWVGPGFLLLIAIAGFGQMWRRSVPDEDESTEKLSGDERQLIQSVLRGEKF